MEDLSLHILDVAENALTAKATLVEIEVTRDRARDLLEIIVRDNGRGMDPETARVAQDPFVTTRKTRRVGLGLALLEQAARAAGGGLSVTSGPARGTEVRATFQASHIDLKPLGDMGSTLATLIAGNPDRDFVYAATFNGEGVIVDTRAIKAELGDGAAINDPAVLTFIKGVLNKNIKELNSGLS